MQKPTVDQPMMGTLVHWGQTLYEPLLPPLVQSRNEGTFAKTHRQEPDRVHLFLAGLIAEAIGTLPDTDPWKHLSARCGNITVGENPPEEDGAVRDADGEPFGSWRDATDLISLEAATPWEDSALAALTEPLEPAAAAILAAASRGWRAAMRMIRQVQIVGNRPEVAEEYQGLPFLNDPEYLAANDLAHARLCAVDALRWAVHRRRAYLGRNDPWLEDAVSMWAWRATRRELEAGWTDADAARDIEASRIRSIGER